MINQNLSQSSQKESTISKEARYAFLIAIAFAVAGFLNFFASLRISLETQIPVSFIDAIAILIFAIAALSSSMSIRAGEKERGVWRLIIGFAVTLGIRNFVNEGMVYLFAALVIVMAPLTALLTLKKDKFNRALWIGIIAGSAYLAFDLLVVRFVPGYRQGGETIEPMFRIAPYILVALGTTFVFLLFRNSRHLLLSSKVILVMLFMVLVPLIVLGSVSTVSLRTSLLPRQQHEMGSRTAYLAQNVNTFLKTTKNALISEAQSPEIREYLLTINRPGTDRSYRDAALESLQFYQRKDFIHIKSYAILDMDGINLLDTATDNVANDESTRPYFAKTVETGTVQVFIQRGVAAGEYFLIFSAPITSAAGTKIGVLRVQYDTKVLSQFFENYIALTASSEEAEDFAAMLYEIPVTPIDENDPNAVYLVLANSENNLWNFKVANHLTTNIITPLQTGGFLPPGSTAQLSLDLFGIEKGLANREGTTASTFEGQAFPRDEQEVTSPLDFIGVAPVEEHPEWIVITSQSLYSINQPFVDQRETVTFITILIAIGAAILAYIGSRYLVSPILDLTEVAEKVTKGDLSTRAIINTDDEIGTLGTAFNTMTSELNNLVATLEDRVSSRTRDLERRSQQLRAAVEVGKVAVSLRDLNSLLMQATELISRRFGFYHVGIFLLDDEGEYAVLRAANSEGGKRMLAREHKLKVGQVGIVGYVTKTGQARIALDVGQDATYFDNPDLPETRSEMALALIAGGKIAGALDIQSTQGQAFSDADVATLQVLADQIAVSLENARLFEENSNALQALRRAYGEQSHIGWQELMHTRNEYGYLGKGDGSVIPLSKPDDPDFEKVFQQKDIVLNKIESTANIPIMVRGNPIGMLRLAKPETAPSWTETELDLARTMSTELSGALESARLFNETRKQAQQEYVVGEITNKMRETMNVESVIKIAADEIYKLLSLEHITIYFTPGDDEENGKEGAA